MEKTMIWTCTVGEVSPQDASSSPPDFPMRKAVEKAYREITGQEPNFCFSGWGAELTKAQRDCVNKL